MSREIRRVPLGYEPPRDPCTYRHGWMSDPCPGWHHRPQFDQSYRQALAKWETDKAAWEAGTHENLAFDAVYHRRGGGEWKGRHLKGVPAKVYAADGETVEREVWFETVEQYVRDVPWEKSGEGGEPPTDDGSYRPDWPDDAELGYCYYETVSEGTPLSPVFATTDELAGWLVEHEGMSPDGAARFIGLGWAPSLMSGPGFGVVTGMEAVDRSIIGGEP
jgi:hypothetical protein